MQREIASSACWSGRGEPVKSCARRSYRPPVSFPVTAATTSATSSTRSSSRTCTVSSREASSSNTIEYKIGEIFGEVKNKIQSGYNLREIIDHVDELHFRSQTEKREPSHIYEAKIRNIVNAGPNGGRILCACDRSRRDEFLFLG